MYFASRCYVSRPFPVDKLPGVVSEMEAQVLGKNRFKLGRSFRERRELSFIFVVPRPVSLSCFDARKLLDIIGVDFYKDNLDGVVAAELLNRIGDYACRRSGEAGSPKKIEVLSSIPTIPSLYFFADFFQLYIRTDNRLHDTTPENFCEQLNTAMREFRSVIDEMPEFQVVDGVARWNGPVKWDGSRSKYIVMKEQEGDTVEISMPKTSFQAVSQIISNMIASRKNVLVEARFDLDLKHHKQWVESGPFEDGCLEYNVYDSPVDKAVQESIRGKRPLEVDFVPLFTFFPKKGRPLRICVMIDKSMAELVIGYESWIEPVDEAVFTCFVEDAQLEKLFPDLT